VPNASVALLLFLAYMSEDDGCIRIGVIQVLVQVSVAFLILDVHDHGTNISFVVVGHGGCARVAYLHCLLFALDRF